ncbi:DNA uptake protein [Mesoplasma florum W37]|uniref:Metallo-beta-lactamase domain-containing protein n=1 Tax=Mesoplasma florum TaxID=2151 RepID=A0AAD0MN14_MESFO|nr:MBL fold metallo-hydrolase [Mesoplasma florum]AGY41100.1 DNA uptake protein [Mesoplasma florum W37]AVN59332.1 hypothetical protein CG008_00160 [Mesoplasma florum]AVN60713.1 hypothetical protein CG005_00150 [Mesoplasma florum]AVN65438.1 hypothetical protein MflW12_0330 [Mesoplasma florum]
MKNSFKIKIFFLITITLAIMSMFVVSCSTKIIELTGNVNFYVAAVGNANFTMVEKDGHGVILDAGSGLSDKKMVENYDEGNDPKSDLWSKANKQITDWAVKFMKETAHIEHLDAAFISHKHSDHYDMLFGILDEYKNDKTVVVAPIDNKGLEKTIKLTTPDWNGKVNTKFSKSYNFLGGTFENLTAYSSKKTLKEIHKTNDQNDTSMAISFTANGHSVLSLGDLQNQGATRDDKFQEKVAQKEYDVLLAAHHGSNNSATETIVNLYDFPIKHIIFSGTAYSNNSNIWNKYSGGHAMKPYSIANSIEKASLIKNYTKFYITGFIEDEYTDKLFGDNQNGSYKWSSQNNEILKLSSTILDSDYR